MPPGGGRGRRPNGSISPPIIAPHSSRITFNLFAWNWESRCKCILKKANCYFILLLLQKKFEAELSSPHRWENWSHKNHHHHCAEINGCINYFFCWTGCLFKGLIFFVFWGIFLTVLSLSLSPQWGVLITLCWTISRSIPWLHLFKILCWSGAASIPLQFYIPRLIFANFTRTSSTNTNWAKQQQLRVQSKK